MDTFIDKIPTDLSIKNNIIVILGILIVLGLSGFHRQVISLIIIIIAYLFYQKKFTSPKDLINTVERFVNTHFTPEADKNIIQELRGKLTHISKIEESKKVLFQYMENIDKKINNGELMISSTMDFSNIYMDELTKTFQHLFNQYYQIASLLTDINHQYPHQTMTFFLDTQIQTLKESHTFIFISPGNKLPQELEEIRKTLVTNFKLVNTEITKKHNNKQPEDYNMYSSVLPEPHEPLAKNSFQDNCSPY